MTDDPPTEIDDPPDNRPEQGDEDGLRANEHRPHRRSPHPSISRSSVSTVTPEPPRQAPDPGHSGDGPDPNGWVGLVKWLLTDHRRAAWAFAAFLAGLAALVLTTGLLAPHVGDLGGIVGGSLVGGGITVGAGRLAQRRRRGQELPDQE